MQVSVWPSASLLGRFVCTGCIYRRSTLVTLCGVWNSSGTVDSYLQFLVQLYCLWFENLEPSVCSTSIDRQVLLCACSNVSSMSIRKSAADSSAVCHRPIDAVVADPASSAPTTNILSELNWSYCKMQTISFALRRLKLTFRRVLKFIDLRKS